jgi:hypothetical protein
MYICGSWFVLYVLVDSRSPWMEWNSSADSQTSRITRTNCHIYKWLPPGDGLLASPKHVESNDYQYFNYNF